MVGNGFSDEYSMVKGGSDSLGVSLNEGFEQTVSVNRGVSPPSGESEIIATLSHLTTAVKKSVANVLMGSKSVLPTEKITGVSRPIS